MTFNEHPCSSLGLSKTYTVAIICEFSVVKASPIMLSMLAMERTSRSAITVGTKHFRIPTCPMLQQMFDCPLCRMKKRLLEMQFAAITQ